MTGGQGRSGHTTGAALGAWLPPLAWMALIFWLSSRPDLPHAPSAWLDYLAKKSLHAGGYAVLALLWLRAFDFAGIAHPARWALAVTVAYAIGDELHQTFVPGRSGRLLDVMIDAAGAAAGLALAAAAGAHARRG